MFVLRDEFCSFFIIDHHFFAIDYLYNLVLTKFKLLKMFTRQETDKNR